MEDTPEKKSVEEMTEIAIDTWNNSDEKSAPATMREVVKKLNQVFHQELQKALTEREAEMVKTPDTEVGAYSRGYKQGRFDADMDRLNKTPTPDTEWEREFDDTFGYFASIARSGKTQPFPCEIKNFIANLLTSRDTYWKERVREEMEEILYENLMKEDLSLETIKPEMKTWRFANEHTIDSIRQALTLPITEEKHDHI